MDKETLGQITEALKDNPGALEAITGTISQLQSKETMLKDLTNKKNDISTELTLFKDKLNSVGVKDPNDITTMIAELRNKKDTPPQNSPEAKPKKKDDVFTSSPEYQKVLEQLKKADDDRNQAAIDRKELNSLKESIKQKDLKEDSRKIDDALRKILYRTDDDGKPVYYKPELLIKNSKDKLETVNGEVFWKNPDNPDIPIRFKDGVETFTNSDDIKDMQLSKIKTGAGSKPSGDANKPKWDPRKRQQELRDQRELKFF